MNQEEEIELPEIKKGKKDKSKKKEPKEKPHKEEKEKTKKKDKTDKGKKNKQKRNEKISDATIEEQPLEEIIEIENQTQQGIHQFGSTIFEGKKKRRSSSSLKKYIGDHLGLPDIEEIREIIEPFEVDVQNDFQILFVDRTNRLFYHSHMSECVTIVTKYNIFFFNSRLQLQENEEPIQINEIRKISTSLERDNAIIIHLDDFMTELLMTPFKVELTAILADRYHEITGQDLQIQFSNLVEFPISEDTMFEVNFVPAQEGVRMTLFCKSAQTQ